MQELYVKLTFSIANNGDESLLPDVIGNVAHANTSPSAVAASREIAALGEFVTNSASAQSFEHGIINYAQNVLEIDLRFLESIREEICDGLDAFLAVAEVIKSYPSKEKQVRTSSDWFVVVVVLTCSVFRRCTKCRQCSCRTWNESHNDLTHSTPTWPRSRSTIPRRKRTLREHVGASSRDVSRTLPSSS